MRPIWAPKHEWKRFTFRDFWNYVDIFIWLDAVYSTIEDFTVILFSMFLGSYGSSLKYSRLPKCIQKNNPHARMPRIFMDSIDKSACYILCVFSRNKLIWLESFFFIGYSPFDSMGSTPLSLHSKGSMTASYSEHCPQSLPPFTGRYEGTKSRDIKCQKGERRVKWMHHCIQHLPGTCPIY